MRLSGQRLRGLGAGGGIAFMVAGLRAMSRTATQEDVSAAGMV